MKKTFFLIGTAALAASLLACAAEEDGGPEDPITGDGDGDGDTGSGGGATDPNKPDSDFVLGGRGTGTTSDGITWDGYMFTVASDISTSTIMPAEFTGSNLCVSGLLAAGYEEWALVGWNIAQEIDPETSMGLAVNSIVPGGAGVNVQVVNPGLSPLRVQIQSDMDATEFWCATAPAAGGVIPWSSFTKECWSMGGEPYDPTQPIAQIAVQTYNPSDSVPQPFEFCVVHIGPG